MKNTLLILITALTIAFFNKCDAQQANTNLSIARIPCDVIAFQGMPWQDYTLQTTTNLANPVWQFHAKIPGNGSGSYAYTNFPNPKLNQLFYRWAIIYAANESANLSLDGSSPLTETVGVNNTTEGQYLSLPIIVFDINAQGDSLHIRNVSVNISASGNGTVSAAYLYQGSTLVASASIVNGVAVFSGIPDGKAGASIPSNTTVPYTVKVDVSGLAGQGSNETITASIPAGGMTIYDSSDASVQVTGGAQGNAITVVGQGPVFSLASTPTIQKVDVQGQHNTFKYTATFNVNVQAIGENVNFGLPTSSSPAFGSMNTPASNAQLFMNGVAIANNGGYQVICTYSQPVNTTLSPDGKSFTLTQNQSVVIPVTYTWTVTDSGADMFSLQLDGINWTGVNGNQTTVISQNWSTPGI